jgi:hypothetical protein
VAKLLFAEGSTFTEDKGTVPALPRRSPQGQAARVSARRLRGLRVAGEYCILLIWTYYLRHAGGNSETRSVFHQAVLGVALPLTTPHARPWTAARGIIAHGSVLRVAIFDNLIRANYLRHAGGSSKTQGVLLSRRGCDNRRR